MDGLAIRFIGSGDAFGSGGRFNTCLLTSLGRARFLVDCGASSLVALRQQEVDPNELGLVLITHLHGDHFGGLPFLLMDAKHVSRREHPLLLAGPPGLEARLQAAMELFFPGSSAATPRFDLRYLTLSPGESTSLPLLDSTGRTLAEIDVEPFEVSHPSGAPSYAYRIQAGGRRFAYSGDTAWCQGLVEAARDTHLLITECCSYENELKHHLSYKKIQAHRAELATPRIIYTHMNPDMLARIPELEEEFAADGLEVQV